MFHATKLLDQNGRFFLTELCRSPTPTSRQRILQHGFSYYLNQVRTAARRLAVRVFDRMVAEFNGCVATLADGGWYPEAIRSHQTAYVAAAEDKPDGRTSDNDLNLARADPTQRTLLSISLVLLLTGATCFH